jgi:hypothetical protein
VLEETKLAAFVEQMRNVQSYHAGYTCNVAQTVKNGYFSQEKLRNRTAHSLNSDFKDCAVLFLVHNEEI